MNSHSNKIEQFLTNSTMSAVCARIAYIATGRQDTTIETIGESLAIMRKIYPRAFQRVQRG